MTENYNDILAAISKAADANGLRDVAKRLDISPSTLSRLLRGLPPDWKTLQSIGNALKLKNITVKIGALPPKRQTPKLVLGNPLQFILDELDEAKP